MSAALVLQLGVLRATFLVVAFLSLTLSLTFRQVARISLSLRSFSLSIDERFVAGRLILLRKVCEHARYLDRQQIVELLLPLSNQFVHAPLLQTRLLSSLTQNL